MQCAPVWIGFSKKLITLFAYDDLLIRHELKESKNKKMFRFDFLFVQAKIIIPGSVQRIICG